VTNGSYEIMKTEAGKHAGFGLAVAGLLLCGSARAAISLLDGGLNSAHFVASTNFISTGFTVSPGASVMVAELWDRNQNSIDTSPSFMTWSNATTSTTQTLMEAVTEITAVPGYSDCNVYYLYNPTPGSGTVSCTDANGTNVQAMDMMVFDLNGVDTTVTPAVYSNNVASDTTLSVTSSSSTPAGAWAAMISYDANTGETIANLCTSGTASSVDIVNFQTAALGYVAGLLAGTNTFTAIEGVGGVATKMTLAVAVFAPGATTAAPTNVVATGQVNQITLSWQDASGGTATNYIVLRSTTSGSGFAPIATTVGNASATYTDTNVVTYVTYYYVVEAVSPIGVSPLSSQASANAVGVEPAPTGLTAVPLNTQVQLTWNAQPGATGYNVLRATSNPGSQGSYTTIGSPVAATYTDTGLVNGTTYYYEVNAVNGYGTGANSAYVSATPTPVPTAHIVVNAGDAVRTADTRWFGINATVYCPDFNVQDGVPEVTKAGWTTLRFPGGSIADNYDWAIPDDVAPYTTYATFAQVATNLGATIIISANYGSGTAAEAAAWVADANVTNHFGFKYWEVGNEEYGTYETDEHANPHDPYTYATNAAAYIQQMKAVDPTIKVGVTVCSPLDPTAESNGYTGHPATNLITGQVYYGWTPVVMSTLRQLGVTPDFAIEHYYPEDYPYVGDNDQALLAGTISTDSGGSWAANASGLRNLITDFFGPGGTNIELLLTENNSEEGTVGKQSVSLVNALYYADSLGQIMQTEFNARVWWDLTDAGPSTSGDLSASLYGWRQYGDLGTMMPGIAEPLTNRYPQYFAAELISHFIRGGDTVVQATSDYTLVSAYAALRTNGSLTLMAINKSPATNYPANIVLNNYVPVGSATVYSYGMPQDNAAANNNNNCDIATNSYAVSANFNYTLAPYSITVLAFAPAPSLSVLSPSGAGQLVLQLAGQPGVPYVLQTSTDLSDWTSVATNILTGNVLDITNTTTPDAQFWRAAWFP
jgi:hypothetical protein